jgi:hypothetical protein
MLSVTGRAALKSGGVARSIRMMVPVFGAVTPGRGDADAFQAEAYREGERHRLAVLRCLDVGRRVLGCLGLRHLSYREPAKQGHEIVQAIMAVS